MKEALKDVGQQWEEATRRQKVALFAVNALTLARPILSGVVSKRGLDRTHKWEAKDTALLVAAYATDLEGSLARATGVESGLGARTDPIADKLASNPQEIILALRGEETWSRVGLRLARDMAISGLRRYALDATDGKANVKANWTGKTNTALRQGTITFASSPLGDRYPRTRSALQTITTATTLASGAVTAYKLMSQIRQARRQKEDS